jgi:hypothetical protein
MPIFISLPSKSMGDLMENGVPYNVFRIVYDIVTGNSNFLFPIEAHPQRGTPGIQGKSPTFCKKAVLLHERVPQRNGFREPEFFGGGLHGKCGVLLSYTPNSNAQQLSFDLRKKKVFFGD